MFMCNLFDIIYLYNNLRSWLPFSYAMAAVLPSTNMLVSSANIMYMLPTTDAALRFHKMRAKYVTIMFKKSLQSFSPSIPLVTDCG